MVPRFPRSLIDADCNQKFRNLYELSRRGFFRGLDHIRHFTFLIGSSRPVLISLQFNGHLFQRHPIALGVRVSRACCWTETERVAHQARIPTTIKILRGQPLVVQLGVTQVLHGSTGDVILTFQCATTTNDSRRHPVPQNLQSRSSCVRSAIRTRFPFVALYNIG